MLWVVSRVMGYEGEGENTLTTERLMVDYGKKFSGLDCLPKFIQGDDNGFNQDCA